MSYLLRGGTLVLDELLDTIYKEEKREHDKHMKKKHENKFYVGDLSKCRRKMREMPLEEKNKLSIKQPLLTGSLVEDGVSKYFKDMGFITQYRMSAEIEGSDGTVYEVSGRLDFYRPGDGLCVELKSPMYLKKDTSKMKKWFIQCQAYNWLSEKEDNPSINNTYLIQITHNGHREIYISKSLTDEDVLDYIENPRYPFVERYECKYCKIKNCPNRLDAYDGD